MKVMFPSRALTIVGLAMLGQALHAQNSSQLFGPVFLRSSPAGVGYTTSNPPYIFNTTTLSVTCGATPTATLSGPAMLADGSAPVVSGGQLQPGGNLLVDNNVLVTVTPNGGSAGPKTNICTGDGLGQQGQFPPTDFTNSCFIDPPYRSLTGTFSGKNPDTATTQYGESANPQTYDFLAGVAPIDISSLLSTAANKTASIKVDLDDEGGVLVGSTVFITTNCTINGVGAGTVGGNPINGSQGQGTGQTFTFNPNVAGEKGVQFGYDVTGALPSLTGNTDGSIPQVADVPVNPSTFPSVYLSGTSFSTANCIIHSGEVLADGVTPACKLYTLQCLKSDGSLSGANCPVSSQVNEVVNDLFDGPQFQIYDIHNKSGGIIHEGMGFLMASDTWPGAGTSPSLTNCSFDPASGPNIVNSPCPLNLLTSFTGPGAFSGTGLTTNPNSEFISIYGVPLDKTGVSVVGEEDGNWVNTGTPTIKFNVQAPDLTPAAPGYPYIMVKNVKKVVPGASSYRPQPIKSVSYGITTPQTVPNPINEPIGADVTLANPNSGCAPGALTLLTQPNFKTSDTVSSGAALSDGQYLLHFYAQDCAGTQELNFTMDPLTKVWSTNFFTRPINIDTKKPVITIVSPTGTPSYTKGSTVYVSYYCTDAGFVPGGPNTGSGVTKCGTKSYGTGSTFNTGTIQTKLDTSTTGSKTYKINAQDGADNESSVTVHYTVTN